jgi:hypothetical protein
MIAPMLELSERLPTAQSAVPAEHPGVAGNARLTAALAAVLLVLLTAEGVTIPLIGALRVEHILIGIALLGPVAGKLAGTGFRFARYYLGDSAYVRKGPPPLVLRLLAPGVVFTTVALFATGIALLLDGRPDDQLVFLHKAAFIAWFALMSVHVLGHLLEIPGQALADWRQSGSSSPRLAGAGLRLLVVTTALGVGVGLAMLAASAAGAWG